MYLEFDDSWAPLGFAEPYEYRIYGDDRGDVYALVDYEDYQWATSWRWNPKPGRTRAKLYLRRAVSFAGRRFDPNGPQTYTLYLHVEIMKRTGLLPPTPEHTLVDHRNSNSLDCRRANLRWVTRYQNNINVNGRYATDFLV